MGLCASSETDLHNQAKAARGNEMQRAESGSAAAAAMLGGNNLSSRIEMFISCRGLIDLDTSSKSDPFCVIEEYQEPRINRAYNQQAASQSQAKWVEVGRSEVVVNSLDPVFVTRFKMQYRFEETQKLRVKIYDADDGHVAPSKMDLNRQDFCGETPVMYLADIINSSKPSRATKVSKLSGQTKRGPARGTCTVRVEEMKNQNGYITMKIRAEKLSNKDGLFGLSDPFLRLSRVVESRRRGQQSTNLPVFKTETVMNNLNPKWHEIVVSVQGLCNGDLTRAILFEVFDYDADGTHDFIGSVTASIADLTTGGIRRLGLISKSRKSGGTLVVDSVNVEYRPSFLDYVTGGTEINFLVAVDFTASNSSPRDGGPSLHQLANNGTMNEYQQCVHKIGDVLEFYDHDKQFPTWGFGGVVQRGGTAEHCFNLVPGGPNACANGIEGIMYAYNQAVQSVQLSGPTIFSQVLQTATGLSSSGLDGSQYFTLLIITDGVITDMENTKNAIVAACDYPLSILIVGVGPADFSRMEELDGDDEVLRDSNGRKASRDIVQFVAMRDFKGKSAQAFSSELLAEIPAQLCGFMRSKGIQPRPRAPVQQPSTVQAVAMPVGGGNAIPAAAVVVQTGVNNPSYVTNK